MARATRDWYRQRWRDLMEVLSVLGSAKNPDGSDWSMPVEVVSGITVQAQDIEIGGVEIKDGTTDTRAKVKPDGTDNAVVVTQNAQPLPNGAATQITLAAVLAKLSSDPATQTTLAGVLAKLSSDPATQTTLAAVLAKLSSDPATAAKQTDAQTALDSIDQKLDALGRDSGPAWTSSIGVDGATVINADLTEPVDVTDAPPEGERLVITDVEISTDTAMTIDLIEETSGTIVGHYFLPTNGTLQITTRGKKKLQPEKKLQAVASVPGNVAITVLYYSEA